MSEAQIILFILASLAVVMTPGQDLLLVMSRAISQGSRAGVVTAAGVSVGLMGHTVLAALGVGSLVMASEWLFALFKWLGAVYLVYLGGRLLLSQASRLDLDTKQAVGSYKTLFITGAISNLSNPKVTLFYLAFLPQFVAGSSNNPGVDVISIG